VGIYPLKVQLPKKNSRADPRVFSHNWSGPRFKDPVLADLRAAAQTTQLLPLSLRPPNSSLSNCGEWTKTQLLTPRGANDNTVCPCFDSRSNQPYDNLDRNGKPRQTEPRFLESRPGNGGHMPRSPGMFHMSKSFDRLMSEFNAPSRSPSPSPPPYRRRVRRDGERRGARGGAPALNRLVLHSAPHVIDSCPLHSLLRSDIIQGSSSRFLFHTVKGVRKLATFLVRSNSLLRPLPEPLSKLPLRPPVVTHLRIYFP